MKISLFDGVKALIFDIDGTLVDSMPVHYRAWEEVQSRFGFVFPEPLFYDLAGLPTVKIVPLLNERFGYDLDIQTIVKAKEEAYLSRLAEVKVIEPVFEVVKTYYQKLPMALGTGGKREFAKRTLAAAGLDSYFDLLVASEDVENHKPHPDTFLECARLMKISPQFCQVFEDGEPGIEAAIRAGMKVTDIRPFMKTPQA